MKVRRYSTVSAAEKLNQHLHDDRCLDATARCSFTQAELRLLDTCGPSLLFWWQQEHRHQPQ